MLLGLDISTSITGATVLDDNDKIVYCETWDTRNKNKFPNLFSKAGFIKNKLWEMEDRFGIDEVYIEQSLSRFRPGFSSAKTLSMSPMKSASPADAKARSGNIKSLCIILLVLLPKAYT